MLPTDQPLVPLRDACVTFPHLLPNRPHPRTLMNWHQRGLAGVHLRITYAGVIPCTTESWVHEFLNGVTSARIAARH